MHLPLVDKFNHAPTKVLGSLLLLAASANGVVYAQLSVPSKQVLSATEELWKTTGLTGLAMAVTLAAFSLIWFLIKQIIRQADRAAAQQERAINQQSRVNAALESLVTELRRKEGHRHHQEDETPV
jgi:hypothetical protein